MGRSSGNRGRRMRSRRKETRNQKGMDPEKRKALEEAIKNRQEKVAAKGQLNGASKNKRQAKIVAVHRGNSGPKTNAADELIAKAEESFETFNFDMAKTYCMEALKNQPNNTTALEMMANLLVEEGDIVKAREYLTKATRVQPDTGFSKYMYLGQLCQGLEAVQMYEKGIHIMEKEREEFNSKEQKGAGATQSCPITNTDISQGYSTIAEIYLTDACFEENAEQRCKECLDRALEEDPRNAEAHQLMASFWLSKENQENAKASIETSLSLWMREEDETEGDDGKDTKYPMTYQCRIECTKILIELEDLDRAESVLCGLLEESDMVLQVWYMLGLIQVQQDSTESQPYGRYYLRRAKKLIKTTECNDLPVIEHVNELLEKLGPGEGDEEDWLEKIQMEEDGVVEGEDYEEEDEVSSSDDEDTDVMEQ